jgi:hypothetical protein
MVRRAILLLATMAVALVGVVAAQAAAQGAPQGGTHGANRDRQPPDAVLMRHSQVLQLGRQGSYCWGSFTAATCADYLPGYPARGVRVEAGSRLYIALRKPQRPDGFRVDAYADVDRYGFPVGDAQRLSTSLERIVRDSRTVGWDAFFSVGRPERHYYLDASGVWDHTRGSKASYGDSLWQFHVKTPR